MSFEKADELREYLNKIPYEAPYPADLEEMMVRFREIAYFISEALKQWGYHKSWSSGKALEKTVKSVEWFDLSRRVNMETGELMGEE